MSLEYVRLDAEAGGKKPHISERTHKCEGTRVHMFELHACVWL